MSKLREDVSVAMVGAAVGLFSISLFLLVARVEAYYDYLSWLEEESYANYERGVEDLWWIPVAFGHLLLSVMASLIAHRYLATRVKSPFLVCQAVGILALLGWGLAFFIAIGLQCLMRGETGSLEHVINSVRFGYLAKYISVVLAGNVLFGSAMLGSSRPHVEESGL